MKIKMLIALSSLMIAHSAMAINLNLYEQPKNDAKTIGTIDTNYGIIPIFTLQGGQWIKVGDPRNGNTGWIKSQEFKNINNANFSQRVISTGSDPKNFQMIQLTNPQPLTAEQTQAMMRQMEMRRQTIQKEMHQMMDEMFKSSQIMMPSYPLMVPVIMVPQTNPVTTPKKVETTTTVPTAPSASDTKK